MSGIRCGRNINECWEPEMPTQTLSEQAEAILRVEADDKVSEAVSRALAAGTHQWSADWSNSRVLGLTRIGEEWIADVIIDLDDPINFEVNDEWVYGS